MNTVFAWQMQLVGQPMQRVQGELPEPAEEEVRVRVAGCGVCHTDPGFFFRRHSHREIPSPGTRP